jgi:hypothetical protein
MECPVCFRKRCKFLNLDCKHPLCLKCFKQIIVKKCPLCRLDIHSDSIPLTKLQAIKKKLHDKFVFEMKINMRLKCCSYDYVEKILKYTNILILSEHCNITGKIKIIRYHVDDILKSIDRHFLLEVYTILHKIREKYVYLSDYPPTLYDLYITVGTRLIYPTHLITVDNKTYRVDLSLREIN